MKAFLSLALLLALSAAPLAAQTLDPASQEALAATLRMLRDPALRGPVISGNPQAAGVDRQIQGLVGGSPQLTQELYELAAQIFGELTQNTGGDVGKMTEALERAKGDPAGFAAFLSPATLDRLRAFAGKISDRPR
jgi:hypothetical protein